MERKLFKSSTNRVFFGVCGGIGEYFSVDPVIVRLVTVLLVLMGGTGLLAYFIAAILIPEKVSNLQGTEWKHDQADGEQMGQEGNFTSQTPKMNGDKRTGKRSSLTFGVILMAIGAMVLINVMLPWIRDELIVAAVLIGLGFYFAIKKS